MKVILTDEQVDLVVDILNFARSEMLDAGHNLDSRIARVTKRYCERRVTEILQILAPEAFG